MVESIRIYKTLDTSNVKLARRIMARLIDETLEERYFPRRESLSVREALDMYWEGHVAYKTYARNIWYAINAVKKRLGKYDLSAISRADIERYKRERAKDHIRNDRADIRTVSPRTIQIELQHLSMAINYAVDN